MLDEPKDRVDNRDEYDPEFIEGWVKIRVAQGWTRAAAIAELNLTAEELMVRD